MFLLLHLALQCLLYRWFYCLLLFQIIMCCTLIFLNYIWGQNFLNLVVLTLSVSFWNELRIDRTKQCCSLTFNGNIQPLVDTQTLSLSLSLQPSPSLFLPLSLSWNSLPRSNGYNIGGSIWFVRKWLCSVFNCSNLTNLFWISLKCINSYEITF